MDGKGQGNLFLFRIGSPILYLFDKEHIFYGRGQRSSKQSFTFRGLRAQSVQVLTLPCSISSTQLPVGESQLTNSVTGF